MLKKLKAKFNQIIKDIQANNKQQITDMNHYMVDYRVDCLACDTAPSVSEWIEEYGRIRPPKGHSKCKHCKKIHN